MTSHLKGPSQGDWSVFAENVVAERDELRLKLGRCEAECSQLKETCERFQIQSNELRLKLGRSEAEIQNQLVIERDDARRALRERESQFVLVSQKFAQLSDDEEKLRRQLEASKAEFAQACDDLKEIESQRNEARISRDEARVMLAEAQAELRRRDRDQIVQNVMEEVGAGSLEPGDTVSDAIRRVEAKLDMVLKRLG